MLEGFLHKRLDNENRSEIVLDIRSRCPNQNQNPNQKNTVRSLFYWDMSGMPADSGRGNEEGRWVRARRLSEQLLWLWVAAILYLWATASLSTGAV
jgi:hypothetical protein